MKTFVWTFILVALAIYAFNKLTQAKVVGGTVTFGPISVKPAEGSVFQGPDVDPVTGAYLPPGVQSGTVGNPVQPISS